MAAVFLCSLPVTLALADASGAAIPAPGAVDSVVTTATHEPPSTAPVTSTPAPTTAAAVPKIVIPTAGTVKGAGGTTTGADRHASSVPAHALDSAAAVTNTVSHVASSASGVTHDAGSATPTATAVVTHTLNRAASAPHITHTITQVTHTSSMLVTHTAAAQAVSRTAGSHVLTSTADTVAAVAHSTNVVGMGVVAGSIPTATSAVKSTSGATAAPTITAMLRRGGTNGPGSSAYGASSTPASLKQTSAASISAPTRGSSFAAGSPYLLATPAGSAQAVFKEISAPAIASQPLPGAPSTLSALWRQSIWMTLSTLPSHCVSPSGTRAPGTSVGARTATNTLVAPPGHAPPPGGASPATAAGAGSGLSIFLILAGLPMLAAPWAKRRLRLASEPWRLAPFVLIPERPG